MSTIKIYSDGGSRGNPGPAAIGFLIYQDGGLIHQAGQYIGETTNNVAEYSALLTALESVQSLKLSPTHIQCYLDSELVVKQIQGKYKIKNSQLKEYLNKILILLPKIIGNTNNVLFTHIPREKNKSADNLVNKALDLYKNQ
jgi:ribonuclease HI